MKKNTQALTNIPILLLIYNRPDLTYRVFARIKQIRPAKLYIAADGARFNDTEDVSKCSKVLKIVGAIDWQCEVHTLFRRYHLGCREAVTNAINWFFSKETEGVIVEDDCIPHPTFFLACEELLSKHRDQENVFMISASNFVPSFNMENSYIFSRLYPIWCWATWRRAWDYYSSEISDWQNYRETGDLEYFGSMQETVTELIDQEFRGEVSLSWGVLWRYHCLRNGGLSIILDSNLVSNIGFGHPDATRQVKYNKIAKTPVQPIFSPLSHPDIIEPNQSFDEQALRFYYGNRYEHQYSQLSNVIQ